MNNNPLILLLVAMMAFSTVTAQVSIINPTVEHQHRQMALATPEPRFSWCYSSGKNNVVQESYRIVVASSEEKARNGVGDLWDSKVVASNQMIFIPYQGETLHSRDKAYWKIYATLTYDEKEGKRKKVKTESDVHYFEISLLNQEDWSAKWIGYDYDDDTLIQKTRVAARYLRKEFTLQKKVREARLYICGLGQYTIGVNGATVGDNDWFKPALSDYRKRVYFNAYDVTHLLRAGEGNAIGITLAGGRYMTMRYNKEEEEWGGLTHNMHFGAPRMILQLEVTYQDGTQERIVSDESWRITNRGPIRTSNEFDGETYDENYDLGEWLQPDYDDSSWEKAELVEAPGGKLVPQPNPNIACQEMVMPERIYQRGDKWMVDMGQNMVGALPYR
jgi:alpha-L-rhamnosidase